MKRLLIGIVCCVIVTFGLRAQETGEDGITRYYHPNGQLSSEGRLVDGSPEGLWKTYYEDGTLRSIGNRVGSQLDSLWRFYAPDGTLQSEINYHNDLKEGIARKYDEEGRLQVQEFYRNDLRDSIAVYFHPSGEVHKEVPFVEGLEEGRGYEYSQDGRLISILTYGAGMLRKREEINRIDEMGLKQGLWREYYPNGRVKWEGTYVDDIRQGIFKEFSSTGSLLDMVKYDQGEIDPESKEAQMLDIKRTFHPTGKVATMGSYDRQGLKQGLFQEFTPEGQLSAAKLFNNGILVSEGGLNAQGAMEGPWIEYFASGEKRAEGEYSEGKKEGDWTFFHKSGKVEQKGKYVKGLPHGKWLWYHENGQVHREENYRRGKEDGHSAEYADDGTLITEGEYIDGRREGEWFYEVGDHKEVGGYKDGLRDGEWVYTYDNGRRNFIGNFINGEPHGKHKWWWPNGQLKLEGKYIMGAPEGDFIQYNELGYPVMTIRYKNGVEIKIDGEKVPPPLVAGGDDPPQ